MKIAYFTDTYSPQVNGVVTSIDTFASELRELGHQVTVMGPKVKGAEESCDKVWRFASMPYPFQPEHRIVSPLSRKITNFKKEKFDVIHVQTPFFMGHLGQYLGWLYQIPVVHTYHTFWMEYSHYLPLVPARFRKNADKLFTKNFCNRCDHIVVPSSQMEDFLLKSDVTIPVSVIPTGLDFSEIEKLRDIGSFREKHHISRSTKVMIFVGRLGREKNVYFLLEAFKEISKKCEDVCLFIAGDGPAREPMQEFIKENNLQDKVIMPGYLTHEEVFTAYGMARVIAFPSKTETQGLSLLEGLAMGCPAVCLDELGVKDILEGDLGGFLVEDDLDQFIEKLLLLLTDDTLHRQKHDEAIARSRHFSSAVMAAKMDSVYRNLLSTYTAKPSRKARFKQFWDSVFKF